MPIDRTSHLTAETSEQTNGPRRSFFRSFMNFLSSNIGLIIVVVAYTIGGAYLFILLEQYVELQTCQQASLNENVSITNISETMYNYVTLSSDNTTIIYEQMVSYMESYTNDIYERLDDYHYSGQDCPTASRWTFPSALLFTISIVTSIGYGQVTPTTWEGQITCICYALIGIPIFLLCLANISSILGDMFRFLYSSFLHCILCCCRIYSRNNRRRKRAERSANQQKMGYMGTTAIDPHWPEATYQSYNDKLSDDDGDDDDDDEENPEDEKNDVWNRMESRVPVFVVISIIIGYIFLGGIMFSETEGWTMIESVYFCYISLSTIGFGDYVPGITSDSTNGLHFLAASVYIIIGLAILAMCFDLIKESLVERFEWLAYRFGFMTDDDDQIDEDYTQYAKFAYSPQQERNDKSSNGQNSPPAYDFAYADDGKWLKGIKDKVESTKNVRIK